MLSEDGVIFEIGEQYEDDDEEFSYSPSVQFSNEEILDMLNMNDFGDEDDEDKEKETVSLCGMSFAKLRTKMTDLDKDQKVSQISCKSFLQIIFLSPKWCYILIWTKS